MSRGRILMSLTRRVMRREPVGSDAGVTLVELLVTVVILGIAFVAIVGGMTTSVVGSDIHRKESTAETVLRSYAEALKATAYVDCATTSTSSYTTPSTFVATSGFPASMTLVEYWNSGSSIYQSTCPSPDAGAQRITLNVATSDGRASESVTIIKRKP